MSKNYKQLLKITYLSLTFNVVILLASCGHTDPIVIHDYIFYGDKGVFGATGVHSVSTEIPPIFVGKADWDNLRIGMICTPAANITDIQATLDKFCASNEGICQYEPAQKIRSMISNALQATN